ncbi:polysaccharide deacetylase family protein [Sphingomonas sp. PB4P5]|uniref:polysaccharide deacetylase family protein n=1 Tax=Parasphingomonas puruogangriensis TaxID=3096155 RepID=UPI002FC6F3D0
MVAEPIFYDASGRRRRRFRLAQAAFAALVLLAAVLFVGSIVNVLPQPALPFAVERPPVRGLGAEAGAGQHGPRLGHALRYARRMLGAQPAEAPLAIAFHAPWDDASTASLRRHIGELDWLIPGWMSITGTDHAVTMFPDAAGKAIISAAPRRPKLLPMVQNAKDGDWDGPGMAALLADPRARGVALGRIEAMLRANQAGGVFFDFEDLPDAALPDYRQFLREAKARFGPRGLVVALAAPVGNPGWDLPAFAAVSDRLFLMAYDEHYQGGAAGPIASQRWFIEQVARASRGIPRGKLVVAFGNYAYDWTAGGTTDAPSIEEAWLAAHDSGVAPVYDKASGNSHFAYSESGRTHDVWLLDAASAYNQLQWLSANGLDAVALWRLGAEDPALWQMFGRGHRSLPKAAAISAISASTNVDIEGTGEILRIGATPVAGARRVQVAADGSITDVTFDRLPLPYQIQRTGYRPGLVALTFDDGPDKEWTPRVLDILKAEKVPATFFMVGENALTQRALLAREVAEGHEIGSHTYTHPNLATATNRETTLELNANQRLFQAFTGRSLRLFRAPYFGDAEPTTADEIGPVAQAQALGYLSVGLHVDPDDWKRPGVAAIVQRTVDQVTAGNATRSAQIVLLHDAGGNRAQTVAALPIIIRELRARGFTFVPVSRLAGLSHEAVMPPISAGDRVAAWIDLGLFTALGDVQILLGWLFGVAITLGIVRALTLSGLALWQARRESRQVFPALDPDLFVSVLIPAYNEERVIERAVRRVLESTDVRLEVIVIDDGSADATSAVVRDAFADEPRVRLMTLANGGKAHALNRGLELASGEIVIALDADTQFQATTIARLARWFGDPVLGPKLGAVAGNAKVGNRVNLVTRWQALEYITAQNLERRALARLDAITVVPGAVGAWRRAAIAEAGGYPADTLAEDQDLTIAIQRLGWTVHYDQYAVALTEAPETFRALAKQRYRWAFGTLQCLWKHRSVMAQGRPKGLARVGLPQAILFQILFASISPIIDLALLVGLFGTWLAVRAHGWAQSSGDVETMALYWLIFTAIDLLAAVIAFALERRERWRLLWLLIPQRIGYRQVMYYVVLKALGAAVRGAVVGWGKLERSGRVTA